jgi:hypothetical protein
VGGYLQQILAGVLTVKTMKEGIPDPPPHGHPPGTRSQYIRYVNQAGEFVVAVHQYVLPNGHIGGSGKPDPKELVTNGRHYYVLPTRPTPR